MLYNGLSIKNNENSNVHLTRSSQQMKNISHFCVTVNVVNYNSEIVCIFLLIDEPMRGSNLKSARMNSEVGEQ